MGFPWMDFVLSVLHLYLATERGLNYLANASLTNILFNKSSVEF